MEQINKCMFLISLIFQFVDNCLSLIQTCFDLKFDKEYNK